MLSDLKDKEQVPNKFEVLYTEPKDTKEKTLNSNEVFVEAPNTTTAKPVDNKQGDLNGTQKNPVNNGPVKGEQVKTGDSNKKTVFAAVIVVIGAIVGCAYYFINKKKK